MFQYKCIIFREHRMPRLNPIASEKLLFTRFYSSIVDVMYKRYNMYRSLKTYG